MTKRKGVEKRGHVGIQLSPSTLELLDVLADETEMTRSELLDDILQRFFENDNLIEEWYPAEEDGEDSDSEPKRTSSNPELSVGLSS